MSKLIKIKNEDNELLYPAYVSDSIPTQDTLPVHHGGHGGVTREEALKNLGIETLTIGEYNDLGEKEDKIYLCTVGKGSSEITEKSKRIGTWIDGKPLYQRTCKLNGNGDFAIPFDYDFITIDKVMIETRWSSNNLNYLRFDNVYRNSGDNMMYYINLTSKRFSISFGNELKMLDGYVTFMYTKP